LQSQLTTTESLLSDENEENEKLLFSDENRAHKKSLSHQKGMLNMSMFWLLIMHETSQLVTNFSVCVYMYVSVNLIRKKTSTR
jgi:hypothetical protein